MSENFGNPTSARSQAVRSVWQARGMRTSAGKRGVQAAVGLVAVVGMTLTASGCGGGSSAPDPAAVMKTFVDGLSSHNFQKACDQVEPLQQAKCASDLGQVKSYTVRNVKIGRQVIQGDRALVSVTMTSCVDVGNGPQCQTASDPNAGMPSSKLSFDQAFAAATSNSSSTEQAAAPLVKEKGHWYVASAA